jgi:hypothetical protein
MPDIETWVHTPPIGTAAEDPDSGPELAPVYRRILRRETHVSRSVAVSVVMVFVVLAAIVVVVGAATVLLDQRIAGFDPRSVADAARIAPHGVVAAIAIPAGIVVALLGLWVLLLGVLPARRPRHEMPSDRLAIVVDDEVIASAVARAARSVTRLGPDAVVGSVGRRSVDVVLRPAAGVDVPVVAAGDAVEAELESIDATPPVASSIRVQPTGRVEG